MSSEKFNSLERTGNMCARLVEEVFPAELPFFDDVWRFLSPVFEKWVKCGRPTRRQAKALLSTGAASWHSVSPHGCSE